MTDLVTARSRFQTVCDGSSAWCRDNGKDYYFDGLRFWAVKSSGRRKLTVGWRTPSFGWTSGRSDLSPEQIRGSEAVRQVASSRVA